MPPRVGAALPEPLGAENNAASQTMHCVIRKGHEEYESGLTPPAYPEDPYCTPCIALRGARPPGRWIR